MTASDPKTVVRRFNKEVIEGGDRAAFEALMAPGFVNRSAPPGAPAGSESMWSTFHDILRPALAGLTVTIHDQVAEGDKVTTRKTVSGRHTGTLFGVEPTGKTVSIVRVENGRYVEHWGLNTLPTVLAGLQRA
ncbi:ester cyclase [Xanthomonas sacchari]|uniref:ester cyclase n=1 Tax=Xanthomonas sacchari TaxID=56458 RepID=UPI003B21E03E